MQNYFTVKDFNKMEEEKEEKIRIKKTIEQYNKDKKLKRGFF